MNRVESRTDANRKKNHIEINEDVKALIDVKVYPSPTTGNFTILISPAADAHFHIYDGKGAIVSSGEILHGKYLGNISNLASGTYSVIVYFEKKIFSSILVRQ